MKKNLKNSLKKVAAVVMMACMLLTVTGVSSDEGIMPCWECIEYIEVL